MAKRKSKPIHKKVVHHAKRLYRITPKFVHGMGIGAFVGIVVVMSFGPILPVHALSLASSRDCDSNAVISCGALSTSELQTAYNKNYRGVQALYSQFGISSTDIAKIDKTAQAGRVYKNGEVKIGDTLVATGATTAGRENISGSTQTSAGGYTFYTRPPSVSFAVDSIAAFVVMEDGEFKFAILAACSNPVKATPVAKPKPTPPKEETPIVPAVVIKTSTQTPPSTPTPAVLTDSASLPETGPGDIGFVVCLAIVGGYIYHVTHRHIRRRRANHAF